jgi:hypothetical protein
MNDKRQRVQIKKTGQHGVVVSHGDSRYEVQFFDGQVPCRSWFSAQELEFLETPSASEISKSFEEQFKEKMDNTSTGMTSGSQQKVAQLPKKPKRKD